MGNTVHSYQLTTAPFIKGAPIIKTIKDSQTNDRHGQGLADKTLKTN